MNKILLFIFLLIFSNKLLSQNNIQQNNLFEIDSIYIEYNIKCTKEILNINKVINFEEYKIYIDYLLFNKESNVFIMEECVIKLKEIMNIYEKTNIKIYNKIIESILN